MRRRLSGWLSMPRKPCPRNNTAVPTPKSTRYILEAERGAINRTTQVLRDQATHGVAHLTGVVIVEGADAPHLYVTGWCEIAGKLIGTSVSSNLITWRTSLPSRDARVIDRSLSTAWHLRQPRS